MTLHLAVLKDPFWAIGQDKTLPEVRGLDQHRFLRDSQFPDLRTLEGLKSAVDMSGGCPQLLSA